MAPSGELVCLLRPHGPVVQAPDSSRAAARHVRVHVCLLLQARVTSRLCRVPGTRGTEKTSGEREDVSGRRGLSDPP